MAGKKLFVNRWLRVYNDLRNMILMIVTLEISARNFRRNGLRKDLSLNYYLFHIVQSTINFCTINIYFCTTQI